MFFKVRKIATVPVTKPEVPSVVEHLSGLVHTVKSSLHQKVNAVGEAIHTLHSAKHHKHIEAVPVA